MDDNSMLDYQYHQERCATEYQRQRTFVLLRPRIFRDGNKWCALYGDNLQDGVAGFGDSPEAASYDFDKAWCEKLGDPDAK